MAPNLRILLTGFEPFGGALRNPSGEVALALHGKTAGVARRGAIVGAVFPVRWNEAARRLRHLLGEVRPHIAISLGMARDCVEVELYATNRRAPGRRDNDGNVPDDAREIATKRLPTTLPVEAILRALEDDGGGKVSSDAGGFLCEEVFYTLVAAQAEALAEARRPLLRAGFVHVPNDRFVPGEAERRKLERQIHRAIEATIGSLTEDEYERCLAG